MKIINLKQKTSLMSCINSCLLRQLICVAFVFVLVSGCGYSQKSLIDRKINSIYITVFENNSFMRGIEFDIAKAVKDEIMSRTKLRIVQKDNADTILTGKIGGSAQSALAQSRDNIVESVVSISASIKILDTRTGRVLGGGVSGSASFIIDRGENVQSATEEAIANLARTLVDSLEEEW
jgi:hypothetical protein